MAVSVTTINVYSKPLFQGIPTDNRSSFLHVRGYATGDGTGGTVTITASPFQTGISPTPFSDINGKHIFLINCLAMASAGAGYILQMFTHNSFDQDMISPLGYVPSEQLIWATNSQYMNNYYMPDKDTKYPSLPKYLGVCKPASTSSAFQTIFQTNVNAATYLSHFRFIALTASDFNKYLNNQLRLP